MVFNLFFQITFFLVFTSEFCVDGCGLQVSQPERLIFGRKDESVSVPCHINSSTCGVQVFWYVFTSNFSYHQLDAKNQPLKYQLQSSHLQINALTDSDDGLYYCAAALNSLTTSGSQAFGHGTTLVVNEHGPYPGSTVLVVLMVLLVLYSLSVLTFIICIKTGRRMSFLRGGLRRSDVKGDSSKRAHFGAVVQELYSKRNLQHRNKENPSTEVSQENKCETPRSNVDGEDIYQNLDRTG